MTEDKKQCLLCFEPLTFNSEGKTNYKYHKRCWASLVRTPGNVRCPCGQGMMPKCYFFSQCGNYTGKCRGCQSGWIDEYCNWCK